MRVHGEIIKTYKRKIKKRLEGEIIRDGKILFETEITPAATYVQK